MSDLENRRAEIAHRITKAEEINDLRSIVFLSRQFTDLFPEKLTPIEKDIRRVFLKKLEDAKTKYQHTCPICGKAMVDQLCPDDAIRPYCGFCGKTYLPMGYDCEDTYGTRWSAIEEVGMVEKRNVITVPIKGDPACSP